MSIEIGEPHEVLKFFVGGGYWPVLNGFHIPLGHLDATVVDVVSKELYGGLVKGTFFCFEE